MNEFLTAVRRTESKKTPKWARTVDGIVRRSQEEHDDSRSFLSLRLTDRLQRLLMIGCCRFAGIEDEETSQPGVWFRDVLGAAERLAHGDETGGPLEFAEVPWPTSFTSSSNLAKQLTSLMTPRFILPDGRRRRLFRTVDGAYVAFLVRIAELRAEENWCKPARRASRSDSTGTRKRAVADARLAARTAQGRLLAGIVGPGWHLAPEWRTDTAVQIARTIYENRDFGTMPILADALNDAGCDNKEWLTRMRDPNWPWCRGCHVLDSLLPELVHRGA